MPDQTVPTATDITEKSSYAYALRRMGEELRDVPDFTDVWICIQPGRLDPDEENRAKVDAVSQALFGKAGEDEVRKDGTLVHGADGLFGPIRVSITAVLREAEDTEDPDHGRTTAVAEAKPDTLMVPHGEAHRTAETFTRYFSFGHGQTDPGTGENLLGKYVTVIAPTADGCRDAMLASRFGSKWAFEYLPGRPSTDEWIPQWTEHERIVVDPNGGGE